LDAPTSGLLCPIAAVVKVCASAPPTSSPSISIKCKYAVLKLRGEADVSWVPTNTPPVSGRSLQQHSPLRSSRLRSPSQSSSQRPPIRLSLAILCISRKNSPPTHKFSRWCLLRPAQLHTKGAYQTLPRGTAGTARGAGWWQKEGEIRRPGQRISVLRG
jgi:hypothetical protein